jgi:hypothetical protein
MIFAFTGPSSLTRNQELDVAEHMDNLATEGHIWRSGCAYGVDTMAAHQGYGMGARVELYIPSAEHNVELVNELTNKAQMIRCPVGGTKGPYRIRNEMLVQGATKLFAYLKSDSFYRSGEWMTVNIARQLGVPVEVTVI